MKVTHVMLTQGFGGAERMFVELCLSLAEAGCQIQAICHRDFVERDQLCNQPNITLSFVKPLGTWDRWTARRIANAIHDFQPQVIHAHLTRGVYLASKAAQHLSLPLIAQPHNYVKLKYYRAVNGFIAITADLQAYLVKRGVAPEQVHLIPNFSRFKPSSTSVLEEHQPLRFVSFGRMVEEKGFAILLQAFAQLLATGVSARLLLGGDGPKRIALEHLAVDLSIADAVSFYGWIKDVRQFLVQGDIFVLPSLKESFGLTVLEAMAAQLPVIATCTPGPLQILDDACGYLVAVGGVKALAQAMRLAALDREGRIQKARLAQQRFIRAFSTEAVIPRYLALYQTAREHLPHS
jgi:glycosyltransferase involved in cell wall biosynthesis